ncbi:MAG: hypothetical protein ACJA1L_001973 [Paracoccaceae bacterium]|jgi:hypothetical protein
MSGDPCGKDLFRRKHKTVRTEKEAFSMITAPAAAQDIDACALRAESR